MDALYQLLVQFAGITVGVSALVALQKMGFNVGGAIASFFRIGNDIKADNRDSMQTLLMAISSQMDTLSQHFNHETTDGQNRIESALGQMHDKQDATVQLLKEIKEYGIKCRKE